MTQPTSEPARPPIRFRGRSFMATVLAPIPPVADWFGDLDALNRRAPNFFAGRPVILDLSGLRLNREDLDGLLAELAARNIAVLGIEGAAPSLLDSGTPPALSGGRPAGEVAAPDESAADAPAPAEPQAKETARSLILDAPVRSGQTVLHLEGDVTVLGAVASGAEVIAGAPSTSTAPCAVARSPARPGTRRRGSGAGGSSRSWWRSTASTAPPTTSTRPSGDRPWRCGCWKTRSSSTCSSGGEKLPDDPSRLRGALGRVVLPLARAAMGL